MRYGRRPSDFLPGLPECGGWTALALDYAVWRTASEDCTNRLRRLDGDFIRVVEVI